MNTLTRTVVLADTSCANCGIAFAAPDWWIKARRDDGATFYCPNGHPLHFGQNTLDKQLAAAKRRGDSLSTALTAAQDQAAAERKAHSATKGKLTKTRNRVGNGVCPCCNRTFANLGRHMSGQHPDYADGAP